MDSGWNLVEHLLWGELWRQETFNFDLYDSSKEKVREPSIQLGGQIKPINFIPESIVTNIVECFLDIYEGRYYMFSPIEVFHDGLRETKKMGIC